MELKDFLQMQCPERYDFREEIVILHPTEDVIDRYAIYLAAGIAEGSYSKTNPTYIAACELLQAHGTLVPHGEADCCKLFQTVCTRLWDEKHRKYCVKNGRKYVDGSTDNFSGDTMNSAYQTLSHWFSQQGVTAEGRWSKLKLLAFYLGKADASFRGMTEQSLSAKAFLGAVYTLGNFIPVPPRFQARGVSQSKDYWDLALACIYNYYAARAHRPVITQGDGTPYTMEYLLLNDVTPCKGWLDSFTTWQSFVEKNFLHAFVEADGTPKQLWDEHFSAPVAPTKAQCEEFFENTSQWILERGETLIQKLRQ